jgi:hypothetical protein
MSAIPVLQAAALNDADPRHELSSRAELTQRRPYRHLTEVGVVRSLLAGLVVALAFYALLVFPLRHTYFGHVFLERGWATVVEAAIGAWAVCFMALKSRRLGAQLRANRGDLIPAAPAVIAGRADAHAILRALEAHPEAVRDGILFRRVRQALMHYSRHPNRAAVSDLLASCAAVDSARSEATYTMLRVMIWAIPIVGFIANVSGLGVAVGGFGSSLANTSDFGSLKGLLSGVTGGLAMAFDATFIALAISLALAFPAHAMEKREHNLLLEIDEYCQHEVVGRLADDRAAGAALPTAMIDQCLTTFRAAIAAEQKQFTAWFRELNDTLSRFMTTTVDGLGAAGKSIRGSAEELRSVIAQAATGAKGLAEQVLNGAQHAGEITRCISLARSEAEFIHKEMRDASTAAAAIPVACGEAAQHAQGIDGAVASASAHARATADAAAGIERHAVASGDAAQRFRAAVEASVESVERRYAAGVQPLLNELRTRAALLGAAAEQMQSFASAVLPGADAATAKAGVA